jgi:hypothetical protein
MEKKIREDSRGFADDLFGFGLSELGCTGELEFVKCWFSSRAKVGKPNRIKRSSYSNSSSGTRWRQNEISICASDLV